MPVVRHGRMDLRWCKDCQVPVIEGRSCPGCGEPIKPVKYTPPGDIRPAFPFDITQVISLADSQWGTRAGEHLDLEDHPVIMNPCPSPDRLDEVIHGGHVVASIAFSPESLSTSLILKEDGGRILQDHSFKPARGFVVADESAVPFLLDGKNLLSPGIIDCSDGIEPGDEVLVVDPDMKIVGSGPARKVSSEMVGTKGMGVKIRWAIPPREGEKELKSTEISDFKDIWRE